MPPKKRQVQVAPLSDENLAALKSTKNASQDALRAQLIFRAWSIDKHPGLNRVVVPATGASKKRRLNLPRGYRSKEYDTIDVRVGDELNNIVYTYYNGRMIDEIQKEALKKDQVRRGRVKQKGGSEMDGWIDGGGFGINYVAGEGILQKRHEYLGPAPMVASYQNLLSPQEEIRIQWTDAFLADRWCEGESWDVELEIVVSAKGDAEWAILQS